MVIEYPMLSLFQQYIKDTRRGKRLKADGRRIKPQTIENYHYVYKLLSEFSVFKNFLLRIRPIRGNNERQKRIEKNYWKKFYSQFTAFLYKDKQYFDNYTGSIIKNIRSFFNYLNKDRLISTGDFYKSFYKREEDIAIVTLLPEQLQFLIQDKKFEKSLSRSLRKIKDICVIGCTVALRYSDIFNIRFREIETRGDNHYLAVRSIKTETQTRVKLPAYALDIIRRLKKNKKPSAKLFLPISMNQFNKNLRTLVKKAGWTLEVGKYRNQNGQGKELFKSANKCAYRFCDLVSSHIMRRTAITTMLMLGMPENVVRKISGHSPHSKSFYRYISFSQSYLDKEIDKVHEQLLKTDQAS
jgi:site-specific recombinase XerD